MTQYRLISSIQPKLSKVGFELLHTHSIQTRLLPKSILASLIPCMPRLGEPRDLYPSILAKNLRAQILCLIQNGYTCICPGIKIFSCLGPTLGSQKHRVKTGSRQGFLSGWVLVGSMCSIDVRTALGRDWLFNLVMNSCIEEPISCCQSGKISRVHYFGVWQLTQVWSFQGLDPARLMPQSAVLRSSSLVIYPVPYPFLCSSIALSECIFGRYHISVRTIIVLKTVQPLAWSM